MVIGFPFWIIRIYSVETDFTFRVFLLVGGSSVQGQPIMSTGVLEEVTPSEPKVVGSNPVARQ